LDSPIHLAGSDQSASSKLACSAKTGPVERWRQRHAPGQVDTDRRCRELELEVDRLKRLVAELLLDKTMLQDIAKKSGDP